jgi:hypothetical protein
VNRKWNKVKIEGEGGIKGDYKEKEREEGRRETEGRERESNEL